MAHPHGRTWSWLNLIFNLNEGHQLQLHQTRRAAHTTLFLLGDKEMRKITAGFSNCLRWLLQTNWARIYGAATQGNPFNIYLFISLYIPRRRTTSGLGLPRRTGHFSQRFSLRKRQRNRNEPKPSEALNESEADFSENSERIGWEETVRESVKASLCAWFWRVGGIPGALLEHLTFVYAYQPSAVPGESCSTVPRGHRGGNNKNNRRVLIRSYVMPSENGVRDNYRFTGRKV